MNEPEILLIEDNPADADLTLRALKSKNLHTNVLHLEDGAEALDFIFSRGKFKENGMKKFPKLILMDLKLPKVDGQGVLKEIKKNERTKIIPVVILSSSNQESDILECYAQGVNAYLVKPLDFQDYLAKISNAATFWITTNSLPEKMH